MANTSSAVTTSEAAIWNAVAGTSIHIPPCNSHVYYFPQGHLEQYGHAVTQYSDANLDRPFIPCQVLSVGLFYDPLSDQPFAKILLQPAISTWRKQQKKDAARDENGAENGVVSYTKVLTLSDANNGGGFSVPRSCADLVFPPLDFASDPPVQNLWIKDAHGNAWEFRHIYRGTPRRHLLTTGWSKFVNAKRLVAGDSVVFMRKQKLTPCSSDHYHRREELFIGIRRARRIGGKNCSWKLCDGNSADVEVLEAMEKAEKGMAFEVAYYPGVGSPEFVVMVEKVEKASRISWRTGMRVKMEVEIDDSTRIVSSEGTITAAASPEIGLWRGSPWRMLKVNWDDSETVSNADRVSPWEIEYIPPLSQHIHFEFPPPKKFKFFPDFLHEGMLINGEEGEFRFPSITELTRPISRSGDEYKNHNISKETLTQLLTNCISQSSHVSVISSFRLFGKTIRICETAEGNADRF